MSMTDVAPVAPIGRRAVAFMIDSVIGGLLAFVAAVAVSFVVGVPQVSVSASADVVAAAFFRSVLVVYGTVAVASVVWWLIVSVLQGGTGSLGMRIMGLRLVRADEAGSVGFGRAVLRNVVFGLAGAVVVGYFSPLFDGSGRAQGWHDKAVDALMIDVRAGAATSTHEGARTEAAASDLSAPAEFPGVPGVHSVPPLSSDAVPLVPVPPLLTGQQPPPLVPESDVSEPDVITAVPGVSPTVVPPAGRNTQILSGPVSTPVAEPRTAPTATTPSVSPTVDDEEEDEDLEATRMSIPGHRLLFVWDDGSRVTVSRRAVFGRNPVADGDAVLIPVRDETLSLSKTHFEAGAEVSGGWVMDRHSTNGMTLVRDGVRIACPPGERVQVRLGDAIEIGDRIVTVGGYA